MLAFKIAYRFLKNRKGQTLLIALAVAIGISIQIFLGLLIQNLQNDLVNTTIGSTSHITVKDSDNEVIDNGSILLNKVQKTSDKIITAIEVLDRQGLVSKGDKNMAVLLRGLEIEKANDIYSFNKKIINGILPSKDNEIAIGKVLAEDLGVNIGDNIKLLTSDNKEHTLNITGIIDFKVQSLNENYIISDINSIRRIYELGDNSITSIETQLSNKDIFLAEDISVDIKKNISDNLMVSNWIESNESLLSGLKGQSASSYTIQVFIVLSVLVAIASILAINVLQKTKQIGILKAMGITDGTASLIFIFQGSMIGVFGALIGSGLGIVLFEVFTKVVKNSDGSPLISGAINSNFIIISSLIAIVACVISSIVPAIKSLKLNPVEAIKL